jgi:hypothetical protein
MLRLGRSGAGAVAALVVVGAVAPAARAQVPAAIDRAEGIDDPKLERRLGSRVSLAEGTSSPVAEGAPSLAAPSSLALVPAATYAPSSADGPADVVSATPSAPEPGGPKVPRLKFAYRRFTFAQIGPPTAPGSGGSEIFNVVSVDLYPVSNTWRFGLSTQYGWEDGTFRSNRDAFFAETLSLGGQLPGDVFTPFFELYGGGGLLQRLPAPTLNAHATAYGELGIDVGTEIFLARHAYLSIAGGYLHNVNGFLQAKKATSISGDTLCFKVGFGF